MTVDHKIQAKKAGRHTLVGAAQTKYECDTNKAIIITV